MQGTEAVRELIGGNKVNKDLEHGRSWHIKQNEDYELVCFDAFGNRDYYDYLFYNKHTGRCLWRLNKVSEDKAIARWNEYFKNHKWEGGRHPDYKDKKDWGRHDKEESRQD